MKALGVYRESVYSPGREGDDAMILEATAAALAHRGVQVCLRRPHEIDAFSAPSQLVFTMAQGEAALAVLQRWQEQNTPVVNTATAIRNCRRALTVALCAAAGVPMPQSWLVPTAPVVSLARASVWGVTEQVPAERGGSARCNFSSRLWVKRADVHATHPSDVVQVEDETTLARTLAEFAHRGITHALIQVHCPGTVVKFYGVGPGYFFDCPALDPVTHERLAALTAAAACVLGLEIFGGDCILAPDGTLLLIDLNDWPSFARCRERAAHAIAEYLCQRIPRVL